MQASITGTPLEIERKFLIKMPSVSLLSAVSTRCINIAQTYLKRSDPDYSRRIRKSEENGSAIYNYNEKRKLSSIIREEKEHIISEAEYSLLSEEADPALNTILKTRWCVPYHNHILEIDVFPFWDDRAILEIELSSPDDSFDLPDWIGQVYEVSANDRYLNTSLARNVINEFLDNLSWRSAAEVANINQLEETV